MEGRRQEGVKKTNSLIAYGGTKKDFKEEILIEVCQYTGHRKANLLFTSPYTENTLQSCYAYKIYYLVMKSE